MLLGGQAANKKTTPSLSEWCQSAANCAGPCVTGAARGAQGKGCTWRTCHWEIKGLKPETVTQRQHFSPVLLLLNVELRDRNYIQVVRK